MRYLITLSLFFLPNVSFGQASSLGDQPVTTLMKRMIERKFEQEPMHNTLECVRRVEKMRTTEIFETVCGDGPESCKSESGLPRRSSNTKNEVNALMGVTSAGTVEGVMAIVAIVRDMRAKQTALDAMLPAVQAIEKSENTDRLVVRDLISILPRVGSNKMKQLETLKKYAFKDPKLEYLRGKMVMSLENATPTLENISVMEKELAELQSSKAPSALIQAKVRQIGLQIVRANHPLQDFRDLAEKWAQELFGFTSKEAVELAADSTGSIFRLANITKFFRSSSELGFGLAGGAIMQVFMNPGVTDACDTTTCQFSSDRMLYNPDVPAKNICGAAFSMQDDAHKLKDHLEYVTTLVAAIDHDKHQKHLSGVPGSSKGDQ